MKNSPVSSIKDQAGRPLLAPLPLSHTGGIFSLRNKIFNETGISLNNLSCVSYPGLFSYIQALLACSHFSRPPPSLSPFYLSSRPPDSRTSLWPPEKTAGGMGLHACLSPGILLKSCRVMAPDEDLSPLVNNFSTNAGTGHPKLAYQNSSAYQNSHFQSTQILMQ